MLDWQGIIVSMELVAAGLICGWILVIAVSAWFLVRRSIMAAVQFLFESPAEGQPSPAQAAVMSIGVMIGDRLKDSLSGALMGHASALSKTVQSMEGDVAADGLAAGNPLIAALLQFSPSLRKRVTKSPLAAMALQALPLEQILSKLGGAARPGNGSRPPASPSTFELGK